MIPRIVWEAAPRDDVGAIEIEFVSNSCMMHTLSKHLVPQQGVQKMPVHGERLLRWI